MLKGQLSDRGYILIEATNGLEGMQMAIAHRPQVIFLDLQISDLNWFEVLEQLIAHPITKHIPVIINTSKHLEPDELNRLIDANAVAILFKDPNHPIASALLGEALQKAGLNLT